jgi:NAD(P)-dependent dehydrogenase (short-subunit alcohol dehydrogenase family)
MSQSTSNSAKVALITGATGAIGKAIARQIAEHPEYEVVLAVRNEQKARRAVEDIRKATGNDTVRYELVDLSRKQSIDDLAARWKGPLHVLVNNAVTAPRRRQETPEGIELQFAVNVLGYLWMVQAFEEVLKSNAPSRVVNVASYWAGSLDLDDPEFKRRPYDNDTAYRQSKQADRMLTAALADRLKPQGIAVNSCHPGDVNSTLSNDLGFGGHESPDQGADTPAWLATEPEGQNKTGKYFAHRREEHDRFTDDHDTVERLHQLCSQYA